MKALLIILLAGFMLSACSKDRRLERRLYKKEGKWNIASISANTYVNGNLDESESISDAGYFLFEKNGTFVFHQEYAGDEYSSGGTWANTEEDLFLNVEGSTLRLEIENESAKEMDLVNRQSYDDSTQTTITYHIERDK
jgi:hypothetical protein